MLATREDATRKLLPLNFSLTHWLTLTFRRYQYACLHQGSRHSVTLAVVDRVEWRSSNRSVQ